MKAIILVMTVILTASMAHADGNSTASEVLKSLRKVLVFDQEIKTEYFVMEGTLPYTSIGCKVTAENSQHGLNLSIWTDTNSDQLVAFSVPSSDKGFFGDKVTDINYSRTQKRILVSTQVEQNTAMKDKFNQTLDIAFGDGMIIKIDMGRNSAACAVSNIF